MPIFSELLQLAAQCCDAHNYLIIGKECATTGQCYDALRPIGATYWFSLPYRFGWNPSSFVYAHLGLMLTSTVLSVVAIGQFAKTRITKNPLSKPWLAALLLLASTIIHLVFLYPVLRHSLADAPAALFALIAIWLLWMTPTDGSGRLFTLLLSGLSFGLAACIRIFYLYPVMAVMAAWVLIWLVNRNRRWADLVLLSAFAIMIIQVHATWKHAGQLAFLPPDSSQVDPISTGIDTVLPGYMLEWERDTSCKNAKQLLDAISTHDIHSFFCQITGKLDFYLGSYSYLTYWYSDSGDIISGYNFLLSGGKATAVNIQQDEHAALAPDNKQTAVRVSKYNYKEDGEIFHTLELSEGSQYKISMWAWSPTNTQYITLNIRDHESQEIELGTELFLTPTPQLFMLKKYTPLQGQKDLVLGFDYISPDSAEGQQVKAAGLAFNEEGDFYISDAQVEKIEFKKLRHWSIFILFANSLAFIGAIFLVIKHHRTFGATQWMAYFFAALCFGIIFCFHTEQRYAIFIMIVAWVLFLSGITSWILQTTNRPVERKTLSN